MVGNEKVGVVNVDFVFTAKQRRNLVNRRHRTGRPLPLAAPQRATARGTLEAP